MEPWSADDPWQERRSPSSGWDEWPAPAPSAGEYGSDQPEPSVSDPWAESWTDEVPGIPLTPSSDEDRSWERPSDAAAESPAPVSEPPADEPFTDEPVTDEPAGYEPAAYEPPVGYEPPPAYPPPPTDEPTLAESEPADASAHQPLRDAEPASAPHIEPWSPDADPWGAAWTVPPAAEEATDDGHVADADAADDESAPEEEGVVAAPADDEGSDNGVAAALLAAGALTAEPDIQLAPEREDEAEGAADEPPEEGRDSELPEAADLEPAPEAVAAWNAWDADIESAPTAEPPSAAPIWTPEPEPAEAEATDVEPTGAAADEAEPADLEVPEATFSADEAAAPEAESAEAEPAEAEPAEAEALEAAEAEVEPTEPGAAEPEPAAAEVDEPEGADATPIPPESPWDADLWAAPEPDAPAAAAAASAVPEPDTAAAASAAASVPEREEERVDEPAVPTELAAAAAAMGLTGPGLGIPAEDASDVEPSDAGSAATEEAAERPWPERTDATEVFPTTWAPPPPPPSRAEAGAGPRASDIRTTFGRAEAEIEEEPAEDVTTAEQAVPWLIGVILLLAGMVIVLLALIFAGDGSLGGGGDASPTQAAAVIPTIIPSPRESSRVSPSPAPRGSPNPSASAKPVPKYGDLEMVYQGRSTALAHIFLLRRDFTEEGEPEVLAQDPSLDVRRFAWSPDGRRGAFLYADLLAAINPGVDVHRLSDGISAITFGDGTEIVYAVRVRADGGNDVATVLAVNQETGHERELDRVSYRRPAIEEEPALAEAQFSDDGGAIRLYWMNDDTLYLWILGGGAWTLDPAEGNARKVDEETLPVLYAPEGERSVTLTLEDGQTRMRVVDRTGDTMASARIDGRVSHLRWSPRGDQVVFTLGRSAPAGGVLQNLYLWNLGDDRPVMITNSGAAFGAEWRGSQNRWEED